MVHADSDPVPTVSSAVRVVVGSPVVVLYAVAGAVAVAVTLAVLGTLLSALLVVGYLVGVQLATAQVPVAGAYYQPVLAAATIAYGVLVVAGSVVALPVAATVAWAPFKGAIVARLGRSLRDGAGTRRANPTLDRDTLRVLVRWASHRALASRIVGKVVPSRVYRARSRIAPRRSDRADWERRAGFLATAVVLDGYGSLERAADESERRAELLGGDVPRIRTVGLFAVAVVFMVAVTVLVAVQGMTGSDAALDAMVVLLIVVPLVLIPLVVLVEQALRTAQYVAVDDRGASGGAAPGSNAVSWTPGR